MFRGIFTFFLPLLYWTSPQSGGCSEIDLRRTQLKEKAFQCFKTGGMLGDIQIFIEMIFLDWGDVQGDIQIFTNMEYWDWDYVGGCSDIYENDIFRLGDVQGDIQKYMKIGKLENLPPFRGTETWTWYKMLTFACFDVCSHHNLIMSIVTTLFIIIIIQKLFEFFTNLNLCLNIFICCWNLNVCSDDSLRTSCDRNYNGNIIKRCIMVAVSLYQVTDTTTVW